MVGFTGSRRPPASLAAAAECVAVLVGSMGLPVGVGCASGIDAIIRETIGHARLFEAAGAEPWQFAERSAALVEACRHARGWDSLAAFPASPCPAGLIPSHSWARCFNGSGSGTWATAAYAAGVGLPLVVFGSVELPEWGGVWEVVQWGPLAGGKVFRAGQICMF
jgi:hypothetical protein